MSPVPSKADQLAEGEARERAGVMPGEAVHALNTTEGDGGATDSGTGGQQRAAAAGEGSDNSRPLPPAKSKYDQQRDAIVGRFREHRSVEAAEQADDISEFTRSGMPPEFAEPNAAVIDQGDGAGDPPQPAAAAAVVAEPPVPAAPAKIKLKVRGQEQEFTLDDVIAKAQMAVAGDNYLDEAKARLDSVKQLEADFRNRAPRAGQDGVTHPTDPNSAHTTDDTATDTATPQHPGTSLATIIEAVQFGNPEEAGALLQQAIEDGAAKVVQGMTQKTRLDDEGTKTAQVLKSFEEKHPDIAADRRARAAIESDVLQMQIKDIQALGVDPAKIRSDGLAPSAGDIAVAHQWYRANGYKVTAPADMLQSAMDQFVEWKGIKPATTDTNTPPVDPANPGQQQAATPAVIPKAAPRVEVTVDRTVRRQTIPQQPSSAVSPQRQPVQQQAPQARDRSSIVADIVAQRAKPRGKVGMY